MEARVRFPAGTCQSWDFKFGMEMALVKSLHTYTFCSGCKTASLLRHQLLLVELSVFAASSRVLHHMTGGGGGGDQSEGRDVYTPANQQQGFLKLNKSMLSAFRKVPLKKKIIQARPKSKIYYSTLPSNHQRSPFLLSTQPTTQEHINYSSFSPSLTNERSPRHY